MEPGILHTGKSTLEWLLEDENPSVLYWTLRRLLDREELDPQVQSARQLIMEKGTVPKILSGQKEGGFWENDSDFYVRTKYRGTVWQLIILAELGAEGSDPRIRNAGEFILKWSQDRESGGFAYRGSGPRGGNHSGVIPCLTGNMVWALLRLGFGEDPRVREGIRWLDRYTRTDDGEARPPDTWPFNRWEQCWGRHTCIPGIVKALNAVSEIPPNLRSEEVEGLIARGGEFLLRHHVYKRSHDLERAAKPKWTRFGFPTMWDTDALEMSLVLLRLGFRDPRLQDAVDLINAKRDDQGRWALENTYNGRFRVNIERKGRPSKWVTLRALEALKRHE